MGFLCITIERHSIKINKKVDLVYLSVFNTYRTFRIYIYIGSLFSFTDFRLTNQKTSKYTADERLPICVSFQNKEEYEKEGNVDMSPYN